MGTSVGSGTLGAAAKLSAYTITTPRAGLQRPGDVRTGRAMMTHEPPPVERFATASRNRTRQWKPNDRYANTRSEQQGTDA
jgi:hypothetical protein